MAKKVTQTDFFDEVEASHVPVLVEFYSDSCIPCKQLSPILGDIEDDYEDRIKVVKVNGNFETKLSDRFSIMASPTLLFFKEGKEVHRIRGLVKKDELEEAVGTYLL